ncbi:transcriptional regulator [Mumia flava]|uniref:Transcriptional regulator n=1 Tax=Mumia flava TaxID=1348852 RepID=A0A0B2BUK0_9ACTN|nr:FMN-binding negative transcriptional regulator [Mumia flava]PJJ57009.1 transcriptional regulator [Mumia flava]
MYVPRPNALDDAAEIDALVAAVGAGDLVTVDADGRPQSTLLPVLWLREESRVVAHMARANAHWRTIVDDAAALMVVNGPQAYVSPSWYATKREHGRVVPTWNYSAVHLRGTVRVHDDPDWVRDAVTRLTRHHESTRTPVWDVTDAPDAFVDQQLRAIVGVEIQVDAVEAKAKLSQNRSEADRRGVVEGLRGESAAAAAEVADAMAAGLTTRHRDASRS